jgi:hypothetical protein
MASYGQNEPHGHRDWFLLGHRVRLRDDSAGTIGVVAAIILEAPLRALVVWGDDLMTFEPLDALTEVIQRLL